MSEKCPKVDPSGTSRKIDPFRDLPDSRLLRKVPCVVVVVVDIVVVVVVVVAARAPGDEYPSGASSSSGGGPAASPASGGGPSSRGGSDGEARSGSSDEVPYVGLYPHFVLIESRKPTHRRTPKIIDFWGLDGPGGPRNHSKNDYIDTKLGLYVS